MISINQNNNNNNNYNNKETINEEILYNSLCFLTFELLLDSLISIGYENDIDTIGNSKTSVLNRLVNDARELGIEDFIQRLNFDTITETCSLLSLSGVNGDSDDEILTNSRKQLEERMKKDSLDQFFFSLTPHILYKFCDCLKILLPKPTSSSTTNGTIENLENNDNNDNNQSSSSEETVTKTISNSIPSIKVGADGTTVLSTLTTKSSYKKFKKDRGIQYGDSIVEGLFYENIIRLIKEEILVSGTENLFSFLSKAKLFSICDCLKITLKSTDKMSDIITKIISKLFNIDHNPSQLLQNQTTISTTKSSQQSSQSSQQQQQQQFFSTPIRSNLQYPKTPLSPDDVDVSLEEEEEALENNKVIIREENEEKIENEKNEESEKIENEEIVSDNNSINNSKSNKRKYDYVDELDVQVIISETDDSEIDLPAKRPSIIDIKMGIKKQDLEFYLVKDLRSWCQNKGLKYNDKKLVLINRILKYLEEDQATSASENDDSIIDSTPTKRSKRLKKQSSSSTLTTESTTTTINNTTISSSTSTTEATTTAETIVEATTTESSTKND
ncbi:hypothetical protein ACTFIU_002655 [Dictyostelium citrinum]